MLGGLVTAVRTLTALPFPGREAGARASALAWFPVVGLGAGGALHGLALLVTWDASMAWHEGAGLVVAAGGVLLTRGLHLDGLADWADGFASVSDRERTLAIMKDPHKGAAGVAAVVLCLLAKFAAAARLAEIGATAWVVAACVAARAMQVELASTHPYARAEGGTAGPFVQGAKARHRLAAWALGLVIVGAILGPAGTCAMPVALAPAMLVGAMCRRRIGGITGDCLGAASELAEVAVMAAAAALAPAAAAYTGWGFVPDLVNLLRRGGAGM